MAEPVYFINAERYEESDGQCPECFTTGSHEVLDYIDDKTGLGVDVIGDVLKCTHCDAVSVSVSYPKINALEPVLTMMSFEQKVK